jgi:hypothetical protein
VTRRLALAVAAVVVLVTPACGVHGLDFVKDERVHITAPKPNREVRVPFTVRWSAEDFVGSYGVLIDRAPPQPGRDMASLADGDSVCKATKGCPDAAYLASHRAYTTSDTSFRVEQLPELTRDRRREAHEVTVVLLDEDGHRIGESAFRVEFHIRRDPNR